MSASTAPWAHFECNGASGSIGRKDDGTVMLRFTGPERPGKRNKYYSPGRHRPAEMDSSPFAQLYAVLQELAVAGTLKEELPNANDPHTFRHFQYRSVLRPRDVLERLEDASMQPTIREIRCDPTQEEQVRAEFRKWMDESTRLVHPQMAA